MQQADNKDTHGKLNQGNGALKLHSAKEAARDAKEMLSEKAEAVMDASKEVVAWVRKNPVQASLISLGIGFLTRSLFRRSPAARTERKAA